MAFALRSHLCRLRACLALVSPLLLVACGDPPPPNVLLIVIDTLRADHLGVYGHPAGHTPRMDALGERGVVFERAVAASSRTAPSHATIMTSRYVRDHSIGALNGATSLRDEPTLAEAFSKAGYDTAAFISNFVLRRNVGLDRGFALYDDVLRQKEANRPDILERTADRVGARAIDWLEAPRDAPFFLWVHFQDPHGPYEPPASYRERFAREPEPGEPALEALEDNLGRGGIPAYQAIEGVRYASEYRSRYVAEIAFVDEWVGRVVDAAEAASADRGLVVLLTADHGETMGEHGFYFGHGVHTLPGVSRVPLLLVAPGLVPARRDEIVHHVDVLPTLLGLAGLPVPADARGVDLAHAGSRSAALEDRIVFSDIGSEVGAYVGDEYVRVVRLQTPEGQPGETEWTTWHWADEGVDRPSPTSPELRARVLPYWERSIDANVSRVSNEDRLRLEALGYVVPDEARASDGSAGDTD